MNWIAVVPTAAFVSAFFTLLIRWLDRPRPVIRLEGRMTRVQGDGLTSGPGGVMRTGRVAVLNVGDGDAYDIKVFGSRCDPAVNVEAGNWVYSAPVIKAGEELTIVVGTPVEPSERDGAALIVTWSSRPRRWVRKRLRVKEDELAVAELLPPGGLPVRDIPARTRRTRSLEALSPRAQLYRRSSGLAHPLSVPEPQSRPERSVGDQS